MNMSQVSWSSLEVDGVNSQDYPDFCDAYFSYGETHEGRPLTEDELIELTELCGTTLNQMAMETFI